jgi:glycosyltransferase involved in cell wall biosynthesis
MDSIPVSVLILTLNEEINLARCLESVRWSDDVVVFDSFSSDRTVEIARQYEAHVIRRQFDNWSSHQNWAVENIQFKYPWVYYSDADEVVTPELAKAIDRIVRDQSLPEVAYGVLRKEMLWGRWLRRSSMYPVWILRLFRPDKIRWERLVNPVAVIDGPSGKIPEHIIHYSFSKGLGEWINKHNEYARLEAREALRTVRSGLVDFRGVFSRDPVRRRKALKALSFHMPFRPLLRFLYMYILRLGFCDGWPGLTYCRLIAMYEFLIDLNVTELKRREQELQI